MEIVQQCKLCKHRWIGHILRHDHLLHDMLEGRMLEKATRGREVVAYAYQHLQQLVS